MQLIAPYTQWVRSYSSTTGLEQIPAVARGLGLKVAAGAWIGPDLTANAAEVANLIANAQAGNVDLAIVGSEALLRGDVTEDQLIQYIDQVRAAIPTGIPVATADSFDVLLAHPNVIAAGDVVLPNIYPYWMGLSFSNAVCDLSAAYNQVVAAAGGKRVIISETGWPSGGDAVEAATPSPDNASTYFLEFVSWARANSVSYFYFEGLDETWKATYEGPEGAHWGVFDQNGVLKPGMQAVFSNQTVPMACTSVPGGPGTPQLSFTFVPPYGSYQFIQGQVQHVSPAAYSVALYIYVLSQWWIKPTSASPLTPINADGTWSSSITTGGVDQDATQIVAFLVPNGYVPPADPTAVYQDSVAHVLVTRSVNSLSGVITDSLGHPLANVRLVLSGSESGFTTSAPDGEYSFVNLAGAGPYVVAPSSATYVSRSQAVSAVSGNAVMNFVGIFDDVDLNGDGNGDAFIYLTPTGDWSEQISVAGGQFSGIPGNWSPDWSILPANFNGGQLTDFFVFNSSSGQWFKVLNNGAGGFTLQAGGAWWPGWQVHVMDLNGDGISDVFLYDPVSGAWYECISTPTGFTYNPGWWSPGWEMYPVNLNGDGLQDLFLFNRTSGQWYWALGASGGGFTYPQSGFWSPDWQIYPGDFNGDGLSDLLLHRPATGQWFVATTGASGFSYTTGFWTLGWTPYVADLDGDGAADVFLDNSTTGQWFEVISNSAGGFTNAGGGFWSPGWQLFPTDFNGDGRTDILLYNPVSGAWFQARNLALGSFLYSGGIWDAGLTIIAGPLIR